MKDTHRNYVRDCQTTTHPPRTTARNAQDSTQRGRARTIVRGPGPLSDMVPPRSTLGSLPQTPTRIKHVALAVNPTRARHHGARRGQVVPRVAITQPANAHRAAGRIQVIPGRPLTQPPRLHGPTGRVQVVPRGPLAQPPGTHNTRRREVEPRATDTPQPTLATPLVGSR